MIKPVYKNERPLFVLAFIISAAVWGALGYYSKGVILLALPVFYVLYLFAQSGLISWLKGQGALVSPAQYPDLQARVEFCAEKLGITKIPRVYIMNGNGVFNAFATSFLRKSYIVLLSDVLDGVEEKPEAINFYIGHEMGHLDRKHLLYQPFLAPGLSLPLLGAAYSRAREYTCDMYGAACCSAEAAQNGLALLAVGPKRFKTLNVQEYLNQTRETGGFWMSFHELIASYPWLVKRYARISPAPAQEIIPSRNFFAFIFAAFVPRLTMLSLAVIYLLVFLALMQNPAMEKIFHTGAQAEYQDGAVQNMAPEYKEGDIFNADDGRSYRFKGGDSTLQENWEDITEQATGGETTDSGTGETAPAEEMPKPDAAPDTGEAQPD